MSLRARITLFMAAGIAVALLLQGVLGYLTFMGLVLSDLDHDLSEFTELTLETILQSDTLSTIRPEYDRYEVHARLLNGSQVKYNLTDFPASLPPEQFRSGVHSLGAWRVTQTPLRWHEQNLLLQTALTSPEFTSGLRDHRAYMLFSSFIVTIFGAAIAFVLSGYALRPLVALTRASSRIAASGSLSETVALPRQASGEMYDLATAFNQMLHRLAEFRKREATFNRQAAHELRSPLTAMRLSLDAARSGYADPTETLEVLDHELRRTQRLTSSILLLAREGRLAQTQSFDIAALAQQCARKAGAQYHGVSAALIEGDETLVRRAIENLLENAARHAPGASVSLNLVDLQTALEVSVQDSGPGLPEETLPHLTEEFYRVNNLKATGIGLGLSVVQHVMTAHQGQLKIQNAEPHGLRVTLRFFKRPPGGLL